MTAADAPPGNWVDRYAPAATRPYLRLARADRPIGTWLLLIPCWWGQAIMAPGMPSLGLALAFAFGAFVMRGAGCTWNDLVDREIDAKVARTRTRPLPSGAVTVTGAVIFLGAQLLAGLCVLLILDRFTIGLTLASLMLVAIYPFMKRVTWWPQLFLGLAFNWGVLTGSSAEAGGALTFAAVLLYGAGVLWTIGYDTIYAHQDREDDALAGVKSSALLLGSRTRPALALFYGGAVLCAGLSIWLAGLGPAALAGLGGFALHLAWQCWRLDISDPALCLRLFRANRDAGLILLAGLIAGAVIR